MVLVPSAKAAAIVAVLAAAATIAGTAADVRWNRVNCNDGNVTDVVCCRDRHCGHLASQRSCELDKTCLWKVTDRATLRLLRAKHHYTT